MNVILSARDAARCGVPYCGTGPLWPLLESLVFYRCNSANCDSPDDLTCFHDGDLRCWERIAQGSEWSEQGLDHFTLIQLALGCRPDEDTTAS